MSGVVEIFNLALNACGVELGVTSPDENSREAALCRLWYPRVRDNVIGSARWPSARRTARLALLIQRDPSVMWEPGDPEPDYRYAHAVPADLIRPYYLETYARFSYALLGEIRAIHSNTHAPLLHYNARVTDTSLWDQDLRLAVVHTLATYLAMPLTGNRERLNDNANLAFEFVEQAKTASANGEHEPEETLPEWLQVRGYGNPGAQRYFYPAETLAVGQAL